MTDGTEDHKATMVHALREEPGSYTMPVENGAEVTYAVRPSENGFVAGWEYSAARGSGREGRDHHEEEFPSHADAVRYLEKNFEAPLAGRGRP